MSDHLTFLVGFHIQQFEPLLILEQSSRVIFAVIVIEFIRKAGVWIFLEHVEDGDHD